MARSMDLNRLSSQPDALRDVEWENAFLAVLTESNLKLESKEAQAGPDGWPYLFASTSPLASEPAVRIIDWLSTRGIGLVINAQKSVPDYLFTYGMLWNFKETGQFLTEIQDINSGVIQFEQGEKVLAGPPSKEFLPDYVREILKQFFEDQGIKRPKILVMSQDRKHFDLCFSLESFGNPENSEHQGIAEAISWFLPTHYSIMLASEKGLPQFYDLNP